MRTDPSGQDAVLPEELQGVEELRALLQPVRRRGRVESAGAAAPPEPRLAPGAGLVELRARFESLGAEASGLLARTLYRAASGLAAEEPRGAARLQGALELLGAPAPTEGAAALALERGWSALEPGWATPAAGSPPPLPTGGSERHPFLEADRELLDAAFRTALPELLSPGDPERAYRESQHAVAREIAATLGAEEPELLLVHAPTGTGKTLAYLLPALLWARRHGLRMGVATYTRALQEQAMEREVPHALAALARLGLDPAAFHVSVLKGSENYLCFRALERLRPEEEAGGFEWLAFAQLLAFALSDEDGDLDRLSQRPPVALDRPEEYGERLRELIHGARAQSGCCRLRDDRRTCGALAARWRAERSHLVLTNHSFALARQEFFRHLVFDECEHLHDQAHAAWSHSLATRALREWCARLATSSGGRAGLLGRLQRKLLPGSEPSLALERATVLLEALERERGSLGRELAAFLDWRAAAQRERDAREEHALFREFASGEAGACLVQARASLAHAGTALEAALSELALAIGADCPRSARQPLRQLELARAELGESLSALQAWLPLQDGHARFEAMSFHDVETDGRGDPVLVARVLLPNEVLGRFYYPGLATGIFLSATTWLRQGFETAQGYLGLDRAAAPAEEEERPPLHVRCFRAPEVFDYSRVLVAVPCDAPDVAREKERSLDYAVDFLERLSLRTGGRVLGLFTNAEDQKRVGARLEERLRPHGLPLLYQGMRGTSKEELGDRFRGQDSVLLGVDTFWYGADFPGTCLEYLVIARLPYGVPDRYHHAQCQALGSSDQRRRIYLPRALAKFRQGFGRLMRTVGDRGCVFVLDPRLLDPRHRIFLRELPLRDELALPGAPLARLVRGDTESCLRAAFEHMQVGGEAPELP